MDLPDHLRVDEIAPCARCKRDIRVVFPGTITINVDEIHGFLWAHEVFWSDGRYYCKECASNVPRSKTTPMMSYISTYSAIPSTKNHCKITITYILQPDKLYIPCTDRCGEYCKGPLSYEFITSFNYKIIHRKFERCGHCASAHRTYKLSSGRWANFMEYNIGKASKKLLLQYANCVYASAFPYDTKPKIIDAINKRLEVYSRVDQCPHKDNHGTGV